MANSLASFVSDCSRYRVQSVRYITTAESDAVICCFVCSSGFKIQWLQSVIVIHLDVNSFHSGGSATEGLVNQLIASQYSIVSSVRKHTCSIRSRLSLWPLRPLTRHSAWACVPCRSGYIAIYSESTLIRSYTIEFLTMPILLAMDIGTSCFDENMTIRYIGLLTFITSMYSILCID